MALKLTNNATSTLATAISASDTTISIQPADAGRFPSLGVGDWFPLTVVDAAGNMEIMRTTARNGSVLTVQRGQEDTAAKAFTVGSRVDVRLTALTVLLINKVQSVAGKDGIVELEIPDIDSLEAVLNGLDTAINNLITNLDITNNKKLDKSGGQMTGTLNGAPVASDKSGFFGDTQGGSFAGMHGRGASFAAWANHAGSSYAPALKIGYSSNGAYSGTWSLGVLNTADGQPNQFVITHVNSAGSDQRQWILDAVSGEMSAEKFKTPNGELTNVGNVGGTVWQPWGSYSAIDAISQQIERRANAWAVQEGRNQTGAFMTAERYPIGCTVLAVVSHTSLGVGAWVGGSQITIVNMRDTGDITTGSRPDYGTWESLSMVSRHYATMFKRVQ